MGSSCRSPSQSRDVTRIAVDALLGSTSVACATSMMSSAKAARSASCEGPHGLGDREVVRRS